MRQRCAGLRRPGSESPVGRIPGLPSSRTRGRWDRRSAGPVRHLTSGGVSRTQTKSALCCATSATISQKMSRLTSRESMRSLKCPEEDGDSPRRGAQHGLDSGLGPSPSKSAIRPLGWTGRVGGRPVAPCSLVRKALHRSRSHGTPSQTPNAASTVSPGCGERLIGWSGTKRGYRPSNVGGVVHHHCHAVDSRFGGELGAPLGSRVVWPDRGSRGPQTRPA